MSCRFSPASRGRRVAALLVTVSAVARSLQRGRRGFGALAVTDRAGCGIVCDNHEAKWDGAPALETDTLDRRDFLYRLTGQKRRHMLQRTTCPHPTRIRHRRQKIPHFWMPDLSKLGRRCELGGEASVQAQWHGQTRCQVRGQHRFKTRQQAQGKQVSGGFCAADLCGQARGIGHTPNSARRLALLLPRAGTGPGRKPRLRPAGRGRVIL